MENSGDESDDVYDQFDLGDFTKEEIKRYEAMVGAGERLRDAAPPEQSFAEMRETSYQASLISSGRDTEGSTSVTVLPRELYELVRAGISNAIEHAMSEKVITYYDAPGLETIFMDEISAPAPQIRQFIRDHIFVTLSCQSPNSFRRQELRKGCHPSGSLKSAQRQYEQDVYDVARNLGLSMDETEEWVLEAREFCSEKDYASMNTEESDGVDGSDEIMYQPYISSLTERSALPLPLVEDFHKALKTPTQAEEKITNSEDETEKNKQLLRESNSEGAKQVQRYLQLLKNFGHHSAYDGIMLRLQFLGDEPLIDNIAGLREEIDKMEAVGKTKEEKAARKDAKRARKAEVQAQNRANRQAEKKESQEGNDYEAGRPEEQGSLTSNSERRPNVQPLEDQDKPLKRKKRGSKRKSELELPVHCEVPSKGHHKHEKGKVDRDARDANSEKTRSKTGVGSQHSPFFQRSSGPKAKKKDAFKKAEQLTGFQPPMIQ